MQRNNIKDVYAKMAVRIECVQQQYIVLQIYVPAPPNSILLSSLFLQLARFIVGGNPADAQTHSLAAMPSTAACSLCENIAKYLLGDRVGTTTVRREIVKLRQARNPRLKVLYCENAANSRKKEKPPCSKVYGNKFYRYPRDV